jgi:hypothetical protein
MAIGFKYDSISKLFTPIKSTCEKYKEHLDGFRKDGRVACAIVAPECKE